MNSDGIVHLTVDEKGSLKIYDSSQDAARCKGSTEVIVQLSLTRHQIALVIRAESLARDKAKQPTLHT